MNIHLQRVGLALVVGLACSPDAPGPASPSLPAAPLSEPSAAAPPGLSPAPSVLPMVVPARAVMDPARARSVAAELHDLRDLVRADRLTEASPRFLALATRDPGNPRLHCEAGFVALRAGDHLSALREIDDALRIFARWSGSPELRRPHAMCLYNRGLVALRSADRTTAISMFEASLALRSNDAVEQRLAEARSLPPEAADGLDPEVGETSRVTITRSDVSHGSPTRSAVLERSDLDDEPESVEAGCFSTQVVVLDAVAGEAEFSVAEACEATLSIFRDWANVGPVMWVDAGGPLGPVAVVEANHGGRGDGEDANPGIALHSTTTLHVFAVRDGRWAHGSTPIAVSTEADCANEFCDDPKTKADDGDGLRKAYRNAFTLSWRIESGVLWAAIESREGDVVVGVIEPRPLATWLGRAEP